MDNKPIKNKPGHPRSFETIKDLRRVISGYTAQCKKEKWLPTKAGFCHFAKISRETYNQYKKSDTYGEEYSDAIKIFECAIENAWIQRLVTGPATGAMFYLKNAFKEEYKNKHEDEPVERLTLGDLIRKAEAEK